MGWWNAGEEGESLILGNTGLVWGDGPADVLGDAVDKVVEMFVRDIGRKPTVREMVSGLRFSMGHQDLED